jgi:microcystin-dependent protein
VKVKVYVIDFEVPPRVKRWALRFGIPLAVIAGGGALAYASIPQFADGTTLTAAALNASFTAVAPPGTILAFAGTTCPTGTVAADGSSLATATYGNLFTAIGTTYGSVDGMHFNVPNASGVFLRGAGSQTISGVSYTGTEGVTEGDQFQGHIHPTTSGNLNLMNYVGTGGVGVSMSGGNWQANDCGGTQCTTGDPAGLSDGTNGTPRVGAETHPANISVLYCIWY